MPANPLHFSAIAPLHFRRPDSFDITALLYSSILVDLELGYFFLTEGHMNHGFWHSYLFVLTIYPVALSLIIYMMERKLEKTISRIHKFFRFYPKKVRYPFKTVYFSCLIGGVSHVFLDMWSHENSPYILFPLSELNPFWIGEWNIFIQACVILLSLYTLFLWMRQIQIHRRK